MIAHIKYYLMMPKREITIRLELPIRTKEDSLKKICSGIFILLMVLEVGEVELDHKIWTGFRISFRTFLVKHFVGKDKERAQKRKPIREKILA